MALIGVRSWMAKRKAIRWPRKRQPHLQPWQQAPRLWAKMATRCLWLWVAKREALWRLASRIIFDSPVSLHYITHKIDRDLFYLVEKTIKWDWNSSKGKMSLNEDCDRQAHNLATKPIIQPYNILLRNVRNAETMRRWCVESSWTHFQIGNMIHTLFSKLCNSIYNRLIYPQGFIFRTLTLSAAYRTSLRDRSLWYGFAL